MNPVKSNEIQNERQKPLERAMEDVINQNKGRQVGKVDLDEVAALTRYLGVKSNIEGGKQTIGELVTATGIVLEETGAKVETRRPNPNYIGKPDRPVGRQPRRSGKSYFFFGGIR